MRAHAIYLTQAQIATVLRSSSIQYTPSIWNFRAHAEEHLFPVLQRLIAFVLNCKAECGSGFKKMWPVRANHGNYIFGNQPQFSRIQNIHEYMRDGLSIVDFHFFLDLLFERAPEKWILVRLIELGSFSYEHTVCFR